MSCLTPLTENTPKSFSPSRDRMNTFSLFLSISQLRHALILGIYASHAVLPSFCVRSFWHCYESSSGEKSIPRYHTLPPPLNSSKTCRPFPYFHHKSLPFLDQVKISFCMLSAFSITSIAPSFPNVNAMTGSEFPLSGDLKIQCFRRTGENRVSVIILAKALRSKACRRLPLHKNAPSPSTRDIELESQMFCDLTHLPS